MNLKFNKPVTIFLTVAILLGIFGVLLNTYMDGKEKDRKAQESKDRMIYGSQDKANEAREIKKQAEESKNRLLHGAKSEEN